MTHRSNNYLQWIRQQECLVTETNYNVVAHHVRIGFHGTGIKPSDFMCVPLNSDLHRELHDKGEKTFWNKYDICINKEIHTLLLRYLARKSKWSGYSDKAIAALCDITSQSRGW